MSNTIFPTAQDAENAFYEALERADLDAMMAVWAEDEEIVCVHPGGERLTGQDQVRSSWAKILAGESRLRVHISRQVAISGMMIAVHSVQENFSVERESRGRQDTDLRPAPVVATNVYLRTGAGWRMIVHHASPAPGQAEPPRREGSPKILH
jgi:ketosteroid isomerase-like protein